MRISQRESVLAVITGLVLVLGATYWFGEPMLRQWKNAGGQRARLEGEKKVAERLIEQKPELVRELEELRGQLPKYRADQPVTAELLRTIKSAADAHMLALSRLEPDKEKSVGLLSEVAIDCTWDGSLEALTHFLYAVQLQGAILDIRQITISPAQGAPGRLKGNFVVFCAFSREGATRAADAGAAAPAL